VRLLASPRATAITSASASHRQLSCRIYAVYERSSSNAEYARESVLCHSPRVCLATRAREVCRERPLNHNRNGGCIALRPKCTSPSGGAARVGGGFLFACTAVFEAPNARAPFNGILGMDPLFSHRAMIIARLYATLRSLLSSQLPKSIITITMRASSTIALSEGMKTSRALSRFSIRVIGHSRSSFRGPRGSRCGEQVKDRGGESCTVVAPLQVHREHSASRISRAESRPFVASTLFGHCRSERTCRHSGKPAR